MWPSAARRGNFGGFTSKFNVLPFKHDSIYYNDVNKQGGIGFGIGGNCICLNQEHAGSEKHLNERM